MASLTPGRALRYVLLPGILPRIGQFVTTLRNQMAFFMAQAYYAVRLLPSTHPYLIPANAGRYGIRDVMTEARKRLVFQRENIDQIMMYYLVSIGLLLLVAQFALLAFAAGTASAHAAGVGVWFAQFFQPVNPAGDLSFILLDYTFGLPGVFGSCVDPGIACPVFNGQPALESENGAAWPTPFHTGLHHMLQFYDIGVACIGILILIYMVTTLVGETAQTGKPFGRRFNKAWAVPRMMMFMALLTPVGLGLNSAQWTTLYIAKWGSDLATNAWILFMSDITTGAPSDIPAAGLMPPSAVGVVPIPESDANQLVVNPTPPTYNTLLDFMLEANICKRAIERLQPNTDIEAYQVDNDNYWDMPDTLDEALGNNFNHDVVIRFGQQDDDYKDEMGSVKPTCGEIVFKVKDFDGPGAYAVQEDYFQIISTRWDDPQQRTFADNIVSRVTPGGDKDPNAAMPDLNWVDQSKDWMNNELTVAVQDGRTAEQADPAWEELYTSLGWGGAAIWYNRIAQFNGSYVASVMDVPQPTLYPDVMMRAQQQHNTHDQATGTSDRFCPTMSNQTGAFWRTWTEQYEAAALCLGTKTWKDQFQKTGGSTPIENAIEAILGVQGLMDMTQNSEVNPLASLVGIGRSLIEAFSINMATGGIAALLRQGGSNTISSSLGQFLGNMSMALSSVALSAGFLLYYVLPFQPFVYVFFAMGSWVKAIFEAMVGLPLWCLAHMRVDGEGIPGMGGLNGWYLLLEIFVRPILIVLGMVGAILFFSASVHVLTDVWSLVVTNLAGHQPDIANAGGATGTVDNVREIFDAFAYTVVYAMFVYMLGTSSFKLIDQVPSSILRWMNAPVTAFGVNEAQKDAQAWMSSAKQGVSEVQGVFGQGVFGILTKNTKN